MNHVCFSISPTVLITLFCFFVDVESGEQDEQDKQSLCVAACTIAMAIPALVGS
jgi:hypothetical protein